MFYHSKLLFILIWSCLITSSHSMESICQNVSIVATEFHLDRTTLDSTDCNCKLASTNNKTNSVDVHNSPLDGCQYRLMVEYKGLITYYSCDTKTIWTTTFTMDIHFIYFKLEPYKPTHDRAEFTLNITSLSNDNLTLTCFIPTLTTTTHWTSFNTTLPSRTKSTATLTASTNLPSSTTQWASSTTTLLSKTNELLETALRDTQDSNGGLKDAVVMNIVITAVIAVGCFIFGIIIGIIAVLGLQRFRRRRPEKNEMYSTPTNTNREEIAYGSIIRGSGVETLKLQERLHTPPVVP